MVAASDISRDLFQSSFLLRTKRIGRRHVGLGPFTPQQIEQQGGDQRTVHDQAGIAFDVSHVGPVVVNRVLWAASGP